jgi:hypothetical protein
VSAALPQFPHFRELLRAPDFAKAQELVAKLVADRGTERALLAGSLAEELQLPLRLCSDLPGLTTRLDDATSQLALSPQILEKNVAFAAGAYLAAFFLKPHLAWLCILTGVDSEGIFPASSKEGRTSCVHPPTKEVMVKLLEQAQLLDLRVVLCGAWIILHRLGLASGDGIPGVVQRFTAPLANVPPSVNSLDKDSVLALLSKERGDRAIEVAAAMAVEARLKDVETLLAAAAKDAEAMLAAAAKDAEAKLAAAAQEAEVRAAAAASDADGRVAAADSERVAQAERLEILRNAALASSAAAGPSGAAPRSDSSSIPVASSSAPPLVGDGGVSSLVADPNFSSFLKAFLQKKETESALAYACPAFLFLRVVRQWIIYGTFVDPHLVAPRYLEWLKLGQRTEKAHKKAYDPYAMFGQRDIGAWVDGCSYIESVWASLETTESQ